MTTTGRNKPSEVPSQTSRHKHKRKKNTEFSWPHTKLDSLMTMAREAPIRHQGWALLEDAHRSSASLCVMEICVTGRVKAYCMHFFRSDSQASQLKSASFLQQGNVHINSLSWTVCLWPSTVVTMGESKLCGPLWLPWDQWTESWCSLGRATHSFCKCVSSWLPSMPVFPVLLGTAYQESERSI